jgi:hypothetical protein
VPLTLAPAPVRFGLVGLDPALPVRQEHRQCLLRRLEVLAQDAQEPTVQVAGQRPAISQPGSIAITKVTPNARQDRLRLYVLRTHRPGHLLGRPLATRRAPPAATAPLPTARRRTPPRPRGCSEGTGDNLRTGPAHGFLRPGCLLIFIAAVLSDDRRQADAHPSRRPSEPNEFLPGYLPLSCLATTGLPTSSAPASDGVDPRRDTLSSLLPPSGPYDESPRDDDEARSALVPLSLAAEPPRITTGPSLEGVVPEARRAPLSPLPRRWARLWSSSSMAPAPPRPPTQGM